MIRLVRHSNRAEMNLLGLVLISTGPRRQFKGGRAYRGRTIGKFFGRGVFIGHRDNTAPSENTRSKP